MKTLSGPVNAIAVFSGFLVAITFTFYGAYRYAQDSASYSAASESEQLRFQKQSEDYERQIRKVDRMQTEQELQNRRFNRLLERWEKQADRQDAILKAQERQLGLGD